MGAITSYPVTQFRTGSVEVPLFLRLVPAFADGNLSCVLKHTIAMLSISSDVPDCSSVGAGGIESAGIGCGRVEDVKIDLSGHYRMYLNFCWILCWHPPRFPAKGLCRVGVALA